jgi:hypothetical protein
MGVRILVDGPEVSGMEAVVRAALGARPAWETWVISIVRQRPRWGVTVLVSPNDRLAEWSFAGPTERVGPALREAIREVGLDNPERRVQDVPHWPERRGGDWGGIR